MGEIVLYLRNKVYLRQGRRGIVGGWRGVGFVRDWLGEAASCGGGMAHGSNI